MEKTPKTYGVHPGRRRAYLPSRVDFWDAEERVGCGIAGSTSLCRKMEKEVRGWAKKDWLPRQDQGGLRGGSPFSGPATKSFLHEFQTMILSRTVIFALFARASKMGMRVSARPHQATHAPRPPARSGAIRKVAPRRFPPPAPSCGAVRALHGALKTRNGTSRWETGARSHCTRAPGRYRRLAWHLRGETC